MFTDIQLHNLSLNECRLPNFHPTEYIDDNKIPDNQALML